MNKTLRGLILAGLIFCLQACTDSAVIDTNQKIDNRNWTYTQKVRFPVTIEDPAKAYNVYLNLRHTADYKYSNIFVLIHQSGPGMKTSTERREFKLAYPDGEWLGSGSGNFYTYQLQFRENYKFPSKGIYTFEFEQNMRDNPLREINDVGIRVEPAQEK
ncbi:gliding motility lipoprotein GldH [Pararcticibacter amylolyticus]|uniref:Gliding motility lipoprotein GldH n=1 Tax=Pararcticibacter amylolyticus TaxID=2173175 RepID=A0A2U2PA75_9SPHI|nr:gliding motility lipoprotein GldH [Pararcticibacter amylolyticus]PWG78204.1 gliding motility lipoprotein GldH [Pararcticibacter amylolyticus]